MITDALIFKNQFACEELARIIAICEEAKIKVELQKLLTSLEGPITITYPGHEPVTK